MRQSHAMPRSPKSNPYCAFKDDRERRIALTVRSCCSCVTAIATAAMATHVDWMEPLRWLVAWFH